MKIRRILIIYGIILFFALLALLAFILIPRTQRPMETGGSGTPTIGMVTLYGIDTPTNDTENIPLNRFLTIDQENIITSGLSTVLKEKYPRSYYKSTVIKGSVTVNYETNDVLFSVSTETVKELFKIKLNTVSSHLEISSASDNILYTIN